MTNPPNHCPFVNRSDTRCAEHFKLSELDHAMEYCFGKYQLCPTYVELLGERQVRRREHPLAVQITVPARQSPTRAPSNRAA